MVSDAAANDSRSSQQGFTLLEVLVSMLIFLIVSASMATSFVSHLKRNNDTEVRSGAVTVAQLRLDALRLVDPPTLPSSGSEVTTEESGGRTFNIETSYCEDPTYCTTNSRSIIVRVSYAGSQVFQTETVYTRLR